MIKRKHTEHEHEHEHCGCVTDSNFNHMCELDPELEERAKQVNEEIKKEMIKVRQEREARERGES